MKFSRLVVAAIVLMAAQAAHAGLIEIRGGIGINSASPDAFEDEVNSASGGGLDSDDFDNYFADLYVNLPALPIGVGLRHEWINQDQSSGGNKWDLEAKNISVLVDWRILDNVVYLGPILSIGYPSADLDFETPGVTFSDRIDSGKPSYSIGAEVGAHLSAFIVGAEAGYQSLELDDFKSSSGSEVDVDLSGFYGKVLVGISFL
jgi:hypothetical protein